MHIGRKGIWKKRIIIFFILIFLSFTLLIVDSRRKNSTNWLKGGVFSLFSPFQKIVTRSYRFFSAIGSQIKELQSRNSETVYLREQLDTLAQENLKLKEENLALLRLQPLMEFMQQSEYPMVVGKIIGRDATWAGAIFIDKGSSSGIKKDMPVVTTNGVVGKVIEVAPGVSKVMLVRDSSFAISALIQRSRAQGVVVGQFHSDLFLMKYLSGEDDVQVGDIVLSSGEGGTFPKGLLIGVVTQVIVKNDGLVMEAEVKPSVNFNRLEEVIIIKEVFSKDLSIFEKGM
jgi:rod shape-determining protein MreC